MPVKKKTKKKKAKQSGSSFSLAGLVRPPVVAEMVGTFGLTLLVSLSLLSPLPEATPLVAALTVGIFVYTIGAISGCHINPAVTAGLWSVKKIDNATTLFYLLAQFVGALVAMYLVQVIAGVNPQPYVQNAAIIGLAELLGAAFLVFGVSAVVYGKVADAAAGLTIGGSLLLGILVAATMSNGVLNPAVAVGIGSVSAMYLVGPVIGGILGAQLYRYLAS